LTRKLFTEEDDKFRKNISNTGKIQYLQEPRSELN